MIEADELWSFVGSKGDVWWVWAALDADTRQVVAMVAGDRSDHTAMLLWEALPDEYRGGAIVCTDFLEQYRAVVPEGRHAPGGKDAGPTERGIGRDIVPSCGDRSRGHALRTGCGLKSH